jgi:hypothetical protein
VTRIDWRLVNIIKIKKFSIISAIYFISFILISLGTSQELNIMLAVDSSGSTIGDNSVLEAIPKFLTFIEKNYDNEDINIGLVSWDDDIDFIIKPTDNFSIILEALKNISAKDTEFTDLNQAFYGAENGFDKPKKYAISKNIIIPIIKSGEFKPLSKENFFLLRKYRTYCIGLEVRRDSELYHHITEMDRWYFAPSSPDIIENILRMVLAEEKALSIQGTFMGIDSSILRSDLIGKNINEPLIVKNVIIQGDLNISQNYISNELYFRDCIFNGTLDFSSCKFQSPVRFENVKFERYANFSDAEFKSELEFNNVRFLNQSLFSGCSFNNNVLFYKIYHSANAFFLGAEFLDKVRFESIDITGHGLFNLAKFRGNATFKDISFGGMALFKESAFSSNFLLQNATFNDQMSYNGSKFYGDLEVSGSLLKNQFYFRNSAIFGAVKLYDTIFCANLDFADSSANDISFIHSTIRDNGQISINGLNLTDFNTHWTDIDDQLIYDRDQYSNIMRIYNNKGWFDDFDECYYDYRSHHMKEEDGIRKLKLVAAWTLCGFGKRPSFILIWSIFIILSCSILFWLGDGLEIVQKSDNTRKGETTFHDAFYFSSILFVAQAPSEFKPKKRYRSVVIFEGIMGWILLGVLVANLIGILTR